MAQRGRGAGRLLFLRSTDVFIIGGGPAGLAAALAARRKGLDVTVADGQRPPVDKACGEGLMPDGLAALRRLGVHVDDADAHPFRGIRFLDRGVAVESDFPEGHALGVRRTVLHARMVEAASAAGVRMLWGTPVSSISDVPARWIVGADGFHSRVRRWAGLTGTSRIALRFGFRIHHRIAPWTEFMELYWGAGCQIYVTPTGPSEVCTVLISRNPRLRLDDALRQFPTLAARLNSVERTTSERGAITTNRSLPRVYRGNVALVGDASGSVDAITGEGLCLAFHQAIALADNLAAGGLARYQTMHRHLARRPTMMSNLMLSIGRRPWLRRPAFRIMAAQPRLFGALLSFHLCAPTFS